MPLLDTTRKASSKAGETSLEELDIPVEELDQEAQLVTFPPVTINKPQTTVAIYPAAATLESLHVLFYRHGNDPRTQSINFSFPGTFKGAIDRGRRFCETMGWKFIKVEAFLTNLEEKESRLAGRD